jgi:hypothetical protein
MDRARRPLLYSARPFFSRDEESEMVPPSGLRLNVSGPGEDGAGWLETRGTEGSRCRPGMCYPYLGLYGGSRVRK